MESLVFNRCYNYARNRSGKFKRRSPVFSTRFIGRQSETQIKLRITETSKEYFDGETYHPLEINNSAELTGVSEEKLLPVLENLVAGRNINRRPPS